MFLADLESVDGFIQTFGKLCKVVDGGNRVLNTESRFLGQIGNRVHGIHHARSRLHLVGGRPGNVRHEGGCLFNDLLNFPERGAGLVGKFGTLFHLAGTFFHDRHGFTRLYLNTLDQACNIFRCVRGPFGMPMPLDIVARFVNEAPGGIVRLDHADRVLLVDLDPQGNATTGSGVDKTACERSVYGVLLGEYPVGEGVRPGEGGYDIVASNRELAGAEVELIGIERREYRLRDALRETAAGYDFVVIDCPPALNMLTVNGFAAADAVIIPMQCEYFALEGLSQLVNTIRLVREGLNPRLEIDGVLLTMYDARTNLSAQVAAEVRRHLFDGEPQVGELGLQRAVFGKEAGFLDLHLLFGLERPERLFDPAGGLRAGKAPARLHRVAVLQADVAAVNKDGNAVAGRRR